MKRFKNIHIFTPAENLTKIKGFNERVDRLVTNEYSNPRFRTQDLNALRFDLQHMNQMASIAVHAKNQERAEAILHACSARMKIARKLKDDYELMLWKQKHGQESENPVCNFRYHNRYIENYGRCTSCLSTELQKPDTSERTTTLERSDRTKSKRTRTN